MRACLALFPLVFLGAFPVASQAAPDARNTVMVEVNTSRGPASIPLVRKGSGFVGPRGEYYPAFPSKSTLQAIYGSGAGPTATSKPTPKSTPKPGSAVSVVAVSGAVRLSRDGRFLREIRTVRPDVRGWRVIRDNTQLVVKSGVGREPGIVELFDVNTGERLGRIKATDVKDGKPAWARHFAE